MELQRGFQPVLMFGPIQSNESTVMTWTSSCSKSSCCAPGKGFHAGAQSRGGILGGIEQDGTWRGDGEGTETRGCRRRPKRPFPEPARFCRFSGCRRSRRRPDESRAARSARIADGRAFQIRGTHDRQGLHPAFGAQPSSLEVPLHESKDAARSRCRQLPWPRGCQKTQVVVGEAMHGRSRWGLPRAAPSHRALALQRTEPGIETSCRHLGGDAGQDAIPQICVGQLVLRS